MQPRGALRDDAGVVLAPRVAEAPQQALLWEGQARAEMDAFVAPRAGPFSQSEAVFGYWEFLSKYI